MNLEDVKGIMKEAGTGFLATTDGRRPAVRPMAGWEWVDDELWTATDAGTSKCDDIEKRAEIAYCFLDDKGRHARIAGPCAVSDSPEDKKKLLALRPDFEQYTGPAGSPSWLILRMRPRSVRIAADPFSGYEEVGHR